MNQSLRRCLTHVQGRYRRVGGKCSDGTGERVLRRHRDDYGYCSYLYRDVNGEVFRSGLRLFASVHLAHALAHALASPCALLKGTVRHIPTESFINYSIRNCWCSMLSPSHTFHDCVSHAPLLRRAPILGDSSFDIISKSISSNLTLWTCQEAKVITQREVTLYSCCV